MDSQDLLPPARACTHRKRLLVRHRMRSRERRGVTLAIVVAPHRLRISGAISGRSKASRRRTGAVLGLAIDDLVFT
jgi:hypothetical protein